MQHDSGQAGALEITQEMIEAGVLELRERMIGEPLDRIVKGVFRAMMSAVQPNADASSTSCS